MMDKVRKIEIKSQVRNHQLRLDAEVLRRERDQLREENRRLREALLKTSASLDVVSVGCGGSIKIGFKDDCKHFGTMTVSAILDEANEALEPREALKGGE